MAQRIAVPFDIKKVKTKFILGLTKRQCFLFVLTALIGLPVFWIVKFISFEIAGFSIAIVGILIFALGLHEKNGQYIENILYNYLKWKCKVQVRKRKEK